MSTPQLHLATLYETDAQGRLTTTREPTKQIAPLFVLIRSSTTTAWAVRAGLPDARAEELAAHAREEPPCRHLNDLPRHVDQYRALGAAEWFGPAFEFPAVIAPPSNIVATDIVAIDDESALSEHFQG